MNGRHSRGRHTAEAGRGLPARRGERFCVPGAHDQPDVAGGKRCDLCGAQL